MDRLTDNNPGGGGEGGNGVGDLRYCITQAGDGDNITFGDGVTGTINLAGALPDLTRSINIEGPGASLLTLRRDTGGNYRIFTVAAGADVTISGMTITGGLVTGNSAMGGGIYSEGHSLTLAYVDITGNSASGNIVGEGGGIYVAAGTVTVVYSTLDYNFASGNAGLGGGIMAAAGAVTVDSSTIRDNTAAHEGGGIYGRATVINSTLVENDAKDFGGGIYGGSTLMNATVTENIAGGMGGGIDSSKFRVTAWNTIIALNIANPSYGGYDVRGTLNSLGHNLIGSTDGGGGFDKSDLLNVNPRLGPLRNNGGPTQTMALLPGSLAVDAGDNTNAPDFDQRGEGFDRIVGGTIDIGAFEAQIGSAISFRIDAPNSVLSGMPFDVTVTALDAYNHVAAGYTGTLSFTTSDLDKGVVLPADYTFMVEEGGVHKFTDTGLGETTLITPGDQTITATDTKDDSITGNAIVTVTGGNGPRMGQGTIPIKRDDL